MDQLKLALEHKFWILAGLVVLLPPIGWWAATDKIAADTIDRNKKIEAAEKKIPDPKEIPNEKWIRGSKDIFNETTVSVAQSQERLFDHQKDAMKLPLIVQNALAKCKVKYRQEGSATPDFLAAREFFVGSYDDDWKSAVNEVKPFKISAGEGLVQIPQEQERDAPVITRHSEVEQQWRQSLGFTASQMWDVQEDVWFLRSLMQAIARVNEGATEIGNARIKRLNEVTLRGGNAADLAARRAGTATSKSATGATAQRTGMQLSLGIGGRPGAAGASSFQSTYKPPKPFDPDDIFGDDGSKGDTSGDRKTKDATVAEVLRWVESGAGGTWNKRGFVLRLVMDEREIPTLLAELSESAFPIEIRHVEHAAYHSNLASARSITSTLPTMNPDGSELTKEQLAQQQRIAESLRLAFNMHYLADVIVAGTLTIYKEPPTSSSKIAPATQNASNQAAVGSRKTSGTGDVKNAVSGNGSGKSPNPISKAPAAAPGTKTGPIKSGVPATPSGNKTNLSSPKGLGTSKPVGSGSQTTSK
jgi:hypothetical protein